MFRKKSSDNGKNSNNNNLPPLPPQKFEIKKTCIICKEREVSFTENNGNRCDFCIEVERTVTEKNLKESVGSVDISNLNIQSAEAQKEGLEYVESPVEIEQDITKTTTSYNISENYNTTQENNSESSESESEGERKETSSPSRLIVTNMSEKLEAIIQQITELNKKDYTEHYTELQQNYTGLKTLIDNCLTADHFNKELKTGFNNVNQKLADWQKERNNNLLSFTETAKNNETNYKNFVEEKINVLTTELKKQISENNSATNQNITVALENQRKEYETKLEEAIKAIPAPNITVSGGKVSLGKIRYWIIANSAMFIILTITSIIRTHWEEKRKKKKKIDNEE